MPDFEGLRKKYPEKVDKGAGKIPDFTTVDVSKLVKDLKQEGNIIGIGRHTIATTIPGKPDKVLAYSFNKEVPGMARMHYENFPAKQRFYQQRILNTLFPNNFPHFSMGATDERIGVGPQGITIRERIVGTPIIPEEGKAGILNSLKKPDERTYAYVQRELRSIGLIEHEEDHMKPNENSKGFDKTHDANFIRTAEGNEVYLDTGAFQTNLFLKNKEKIIAYTKRHKDRYTSDQVTQIANALKRLEALNGGRA